MSGDGSELSSSYNTYSTSVSQNPQKNRRDISQFVKYLLEGSGVDENSVDFAALRKELEETIEIEKKDFEKKIESSSPNEQCYSKYQATAAPSKLDESLDHTEFDDLQDFKQREITIDKEVENKKLFAESIDEEEKLLKNSLKSLASNYSYEIPKWDSLNIPLPEAVPTVSIESMSKMLEKAGFPPFPSHLFHVDTETHQKQSHLLKALYWALENVLQEYGIKASLCSHLSQKLNDLSVQSNKLAEFLDRMKRDRQKEKILLEEELVVEKSLVRKLRNELQKSKETESNLKETITEANFEIKKAKDRFRKTNDELEFEKERFAKLNDELSCHREAEAMSKTRANELLKKISGHPVNKRPLPTSKDVYDLAHYYEERMDQLQSEIDSLREGQAFPILVEKNFQAENCEEDKLKFALFEEIRELRDEVSNLTLAYDEAKEENDILRLKMLSLDTGDKQNEGRRHMTTRELIRIDKEKHKFQQLNIDSLSADDCIHILKDICLKLDLNDVHRIPEFVNDIARTVKLIPEMQQFIKKVDAIVWGTPRVKEMIKKGENDQNYLPKSPRNIDETIRKLLSWDETINYK